MDERLLLSVKATSEGELGAISYKSEPKSMEERNYIGLREPLKRKGGKGQGGKKRRWVLPCAEGITLKNSRECQDGGTSGKTATAMPGEKNM